MESLKLADTTIWKQAIEFAAYNFVLARYLRENHYGHVAEHLKAVTLSFYSNITRGFETPGPTEFFALLNIARRDLFEITCVLKFLAHKKYVNLNIVVHLLNDYEQLVQGLSQMRQSALYTQISSQI